MSTEIQKRNSHEVMSNDRISRILRHKTLLIKWLNALEQLAIDRIVAGEHVEGFRVGEGRTQRRWALGDEGIRRELETLGVKATKEELRTITEVEKELGGAKTKIQHLIEKPKGKLKLIAIEDDLEKLEIIEDGN